jgi:hypothetical protein
MEQHRAECQVFIFEKPETMMESSQYGVIPWAEYCGREVRRLLALGRRARLHVRRAGEMTVVADAVPSHVQNLCWCGFRHREQPKAA